MAKSEYWECYQLFREVSPDIDWFIQSLEDGKVKISQKAQAFLSVGAGTGDADFKFLDFLKRINKNSVTSYTVVDPDRVALEELQHRAEKLGFDNITSYNSTMEHYHTEAPPSEKFDFILAYHSMYYVEKGDFLHTVQKLRSRLNPGGQLLVAFSQCGTDASADALKQALNSTDDPSHSVRAEDFIRHCETARPEHLCSLTYDIDISRFLQPNASGSDMSDSMKLLSFYTSSPEVLRITDGNEQARLLDTFKGVTVERDGKYFVHHEDWLVSFPPFSNEAEA